MLLNRIDLVIQTINSSRAEEIADRYAVQLTVACYPHMLEIIKTAGYVFVKYFSIGVAIQNW